MVLDFIVNNPYRIDSADWLRFKQLCEKRDIPLATGQRVAIIQQIKRWEELENEDEQRRKEDI